MNAFARATTSVECAGLQLQVPTLVHRRGRFALKVLLAASIFAAGGVLILTRDWRLTTVGTFIVGMIFAHMLELVHSCVHGTALGVRRADRIAGVLLGLPMLVSYSDYRRNHLEHHRTLGKSEKKDFFGYEFEGMTTWQSFFRHLLMLGHYRNAVKSLLRAVTPWSWRHVPAAEVDSQTEHLLMAVWLLIPLAALLFGHSGPFLILIVPLLVAVPCHVLIELPEHWHCPPVDNPLVHTRSISAGRFAIWFTNGNNYHLEHHLCPWLSNTDLRDLQRKLRARTVHYQPSYLRFYLEVARSLRSTSGRETMASNG